MSERLVHLYVADKPTMRERIKCHPEVIDWTTGVSENGADVTCPECRELMRDE